MKNALKKYVVGVLAFVVLAIGAPAHAIFGIGDIVIDPTNLIQNTASAAAAVRNEMNTYNGLIEQIKSAIHLARSTASIKDLSSLAGVAQELALYTQLKNTDADLNNTIGQSLQLTRNLQAQYGTSQFSWKAYLDSKNENEAAKSKVIASQYTNLTASMQESARRRQDIIVKLQDSQGQTQATQAVGAAIDVLIGQNQQMIAALAQKTKLDSAAIDIQSAEDKVARKQYNDYQKRLRDAAAKY